MASAPITAEDATALCWNELHDAKREKRDVRRLPGVVVSGPVPARAFFHLLNSFKSIEVRSNP